MVTNIIYVLFFYFVTIKFTHKHCSTKYLIFLQSCNELNVNLNFVGYFVQFEQTRVNLKGNRCLLSLKLSVIYLGEILVHLFKLKMLIFPLYLILFSYFF